MSTGRDRFARTTTKRPTTLCGKTCPKRRQLAPDRTLDSARSAHRSAGPPLPAGGRARAEEPSSRRAEGRLLRGCPERESELEPTCRMFA